MGNLATRSTVLVWSITIAMTTTETVAQQTAMAQQAARCFMSEWPQQQAIALFHGCPLGFLLAMHFYVGPLGHLPTAELHGGPLGHLHRAALAAAAPTTCDYLANSPMEFVFARSS